MSKLTPITYQSAKDLIRVYKRCPNCGRRTLVPVRAGKWPEGKTMLIWQASQDEIVCLGCNCVWTMEEWFIELFNDKKWQKKLRDEGAIDDS